MEKISVIIPVYQVEKYLDKCIRSIVEQTYSNLEIILIDDGTKDRSGEIAEEWARRDSRIKVIHEDNKGLSGARNTGMKVATGNYIAFVDSDDYIHKQMYEILMKALRETQSDIVVCGYEMAYADDLFDELQDSKYEIELALEDKTYKAINLNNHYTVFGYAWNKLYRRECIIGKEFPIGKQMEDMCFNAEIFTDIKKMVYIKNKLYAYRQRPDSIMGLRKDDEKFAVDYCEMVCHKLDVLSRIGDMEEYYICLGNELSKIARFSVKGSILKFKRQQKMYRKQFVMIYNANAGAVKLTKEYKKLLFYYRLPRLYCIILRDSVFRNELQGGI